MYILLLYLVTQISKVYIFSIRVLKISFTYTSEIVAFIFHSYVFFYRFECFSNFLTW